MWNKLSQAAALVTGETEEAKDDTTNLDSEEKEKLQHQELLIQHLKDLVRENEKRFQEKTKDFDDLSSKFDKFKLQSKAKITQLSKQVKDQEREKTPKKEDCDFDDASSTDSSDRSHRGKVLLLKKQLDQAKQQLEKKEEESKKVLGTYERKINDLELQLNEKNILISSIAETKDISQEKMIDRSPKKESNVQEMYAQIVYKDTKILDLNNQILELEKKVMDLQENIKEKDEVLQQRNRAVQLMAEDLNRKGQTTVIELDETRDQMKIMQQNFAAIESDWNSQLEKYQERITELETEIKEWDMKLKNNEILTKNLESARYELSVNNAELQKKIVIVQNSASKQCEQFNKEIQGEIEILRKDLESEKQHCTELQKALDESNNESKSKIFKARVEERTKAKKLERELNEMKRGTKDKPGEVLDLQQRVVELEEEKGSLQLKLIEIEDQIIQLEKLKEDNALMQKTTEEALNKAELLGKEINEHQLQNENWKSKFDSLKNDSDNLKEKLDILSKEHFETQEAMTNLIEEKEKVADDYNVLKRKHTHIEKEYSELVQNLQHTKEEKVTFELKNIELEEMKDKDDEARKKLILRIKELEELLNDESRPYIQLEKDNSDLKQKLQTLIVSHHELEDKCQHMLLQIDVLQKKLIENEAEHSTKVESLNIKISELENNYKDNQKILKSKVTEYAELENKIFDARNNLSEIYYLFGVSSMKELTCMKNDNEAITLTNDNLLASIQEKDAIIQNCSLDFDNLKLSFDNLKAEVLVQESLISKLKITASEKDDVVKKLSSDLESKIVSEKNVNKLLKEKEDYILEYDEKHNMLKEKLEKVENLLNIERTKAKDKMKTFLDQISDLEKEITDLRDHLICKTKLAEELNLEVNSLHDKNQMLFEKCKQDNQSLLEKVNAGQELKLNLENTHSEIKILHSKIEEMNSLIKSKDDDLSILHNELQEQMKLDIELKLNLENKHSEIKILNDKIEKLDSLIKSKDEDLSILRNELQENNKIIEFKDNCLKTLEQSVAKLTEISCINEGKLHEQMLSHNMNFKAEIRTLQEEKEYISKLSESKSEQLDSLTSEYAEIKSMLHELEKQNADLMLNLSNAQREVSDFEQSSKSNISKLAKIEKLYKSAEEGKSLLENEMVKISNAVSKLQEDLDVATMSIQRYKKQCEEFREQVLTMNGVKIELDNVIRDDHQQIQNLTDENKLLKNEIISLQEKCSSEISSITQKMTARIEKAESERTYIENEKSKLSELCESLQTSLMNSASEIETQKNEICLMKEDRVCIEKNIQEYSDKIKMLENKLKAIENELTISKMKLSGEKSEMEIMLQNTMSENKKLTDSLSELQMNAIQCIKEKEYLLKSSAVLETSISEKELYIRQLKSELETEEVNILRLQDILNEKEMEFEVNKKTFELKMLYLNECKKNYITILNSLVTSLQIDMDASFLESEQFNDISIDDFTKLSKDILDNSIECLLKNNDQISHLKNDLHVLKEENSALHTIYISFEKSSSNIISKIHSDTNANDSKFNSIFSALQEKENNINQMISKFKLLKSKWTTSNNSINEFVQILNKLVGKVSDQIKNTCSILSVSYSKSSDYNDKMNHLKKISKSLDHENCITTVTDLCHSIISQYFEITHELSELLISKNSTIDEITNKKNNSELDLANLKLELQNQQSVHSADIIALKREIEHLNSQRDQFSSQSHLLEQATIKLDELQREMETDKRKLNSYEEKYDLLLHVFDESRRIAQLTNDEKSKLVSNLEQMQHDLNELQKKNSDLQSLLDEKNSLLIVYEKDLNAVKDQCTEYALKYQTSCHKLEGLMNENEGHTQLNDLIEKNHDILKHALHKLKCYLTTEVQEEFNLIPLISDNGDQSIIEIFNELNSIYKIYMEEKKNLYDQIKMLESKNVEIIEELLKIKETDINKIESVEVTTDIKQEIDIVSISPAKPTLESNFVQQQESYSLSSNERIKSLELDNSSLKDEFNEYKKKFSKLLNKLKLFKDEKEKLTKELKDLQNMKSNLEECNIKYLENLDLLQKKMVLYEKESEVYLAKLHSLQVVNEQKEEELNMSNSNIFQLKDRYSSLEEEFFKVQHELQEYKQTWEQTNISFELQKEDNERLKLKVKNLLDQTDTFKTKTTEINLQLSELQRENLHLKQEALNLREHADMLISDNDNYQNCIEKLTAAKNSSEQKVVELKKKFDANVTELQTQHKAELRKFNHEQSSTAHVEKLEKECSSIKNLYTNLQVRIEMLQRECDTYQRNQNLLEKEKTYLQHQLLEKSTELQKMNENLNAMNILHSTDGNKCDTDVLVGLKTSSDNSDTLLLKVKEFEEENTLIKRQLNSFTEELNFTKEMNVFLQQENSSKETSYSERINQLENQLQHFKSLRLEDPSIPKQLEYEFQQAMSSLHSQGVRCEELSLEVSKLLEERNILKWKLQQYIQLNPGVTIEQEIFNNSTPSDLLSVKVESPSSDSQIATLHERLIESERTCQELRKANDALDRALNNERHQKKIIEEELDLAKEHITEELRPSDEYHILLGDVNDPEMFTETNFSISRNVQTHAYKLRRWLKGRRNYLCRTVKSRNYTHLVYLFYICFIHIWLLSCVFS